MNDPGGWELDLGELEEIRRALAERIRVGLATGRGEIAALAAYLPPPRAKEGAALAIDIGGSHIRAALIEISAGGEVRLAREPVTAPLAGEWESATAFFDRQAELALSLKLEEDLPIGYCFSYPSRALPDGDAVLLQWHKGLQVPEVVGRRVGRLLEEALRRRDYRPGRAVVLNDTVAALLGGDLAFRRLGGFSDFIGLIVGTGTNLAAYFPVHLFRSRLDDNPGETELMAVNLESGNFSPPHLSRFDDELDSGRPDAGRQRFEKAVSGKFIPQLFSYITQGRRGPPYPETREIFELAGKPSSPGGKTARRIVDRSADLVAAALAGLIDTLDPIGRIGILAEGGVINNHPEYRERVGGRLAELLRDNPGRPERFQLLQLDNVNLIGAAAAVI